VVADREALQALPAVASRVDPVRLKLEVPGLDPAARAEAETRLARRLSACGCNEGAVALILSLPVAAGAGAALGGGWGAWGVGLGITAGAAALGKLIGLARARAALRRDVDVILARIGAA
jgi:hypothetical protein